MSRFLFLLSFLLTVPAVSFAGTPTPSTSAHVALPILFTKSIQSDHAKAGDPIYAKTTQAVTLAGESIPAGTPVIGHVVAAAAGNSDHEPARLAIQFDALQMAHEQRPFHLQVRTIADPITSWAARTSTATDQDPLGTFTQVGGDQLVPSQTEVTDTAGTPVGRNLRGGVYAKLIGNGSCDATSKEVAVGIYSASACGLYGFDGVSATGIGAAPENPVLILSSNERALKIWRESTALLEVGR